MATVTTTSTAILRPINWKSPAATPGIPTAAPLSKVHALTTFAVAIKDAANESEVVMIATFPTGYYYRITYFDFFAVSSARASFDIGSGFEQGAAVQVTENGVARWNFPLTNIAGRSSPDFVLNAFKIHPDSVTNDFGTFFSAQSGLWEPSKYLINASEGASVVTARWMDTSIDATAALSIQWTLEAMMYTVEQANEYPINSPQLIYT